MTAIVDRAAEWKPPPPPPVLVRGAWATEGLDSHEFFVTGILTVFDRIIHDKIP